MGELIPLIARAAAQGERTALVDDHGVLSYRGLLARSAHIAAKLLGGRADLGGARVAFLVPPSIDYVVVQWAIWRAGGIAVPLCVMHPPPELAYVIDDAAAEQLVVHDSFHALLAPLAVQRGLPVHTTQALLGSLGHHDGDEATPSAALPSVEPDRGALLLYTSGTTGKPKGVLSTHAMLAAQIQSVVQAWEWSARDRILHVLPLHHLHGVLNALCAPLWSGACVEFQPRFESERVWARIADGDELTLFMAVPTIYSKLLQYWEQASVERRAQLSAGCRRLRLMVSGSAALPVTLFERFAEVSGHRLLERYGMTEFGMGLGNPLHGERMPGHVGVPFPNIEVRLVDEQLNPVADGTPGRIQVRGPGVFTQYFGKPEASATAFTTDGWFETGDVALRERGVYRILGRESVDILKTGGYKVSALEIEEVLREHPAILECAVIGVPDPEWGQRVAAAVVLQAGATLTLELLRAFGKQHLAPYKVPSLLKLAEQLPRNPMGKVQKPELAAWFEREP